MPLKGVALTIQYVAWDTANNVGKTGDSGNHTLKVIQDGTAASPTNSPSEVDATNCPGVYKLTLTAAEMNYAVVTLAGKSSTADIVIIPVTVTTEGGYLDAKISDVLTDTAEIGAAGAGLTAITDKTDLIPASPAAVGSAMTLEDDAITAAKFDETTAFPLKSADTGASQVARVGADGDTLETLSDQIDAAALEANVQTHAAAALTAYDPPTKGEMDTAVSPLALEATLTAIKGGGWSTETLVAISALVDDLESRLTAARAGYLDELGAANLPADIDTLIARLTAARAGYLDNLSAGAVALEANVQTHAAAALTAYDPPTKTEMDDALAALNDITVADILAGVVEGTLTFAGILKIMLAALAGKAAGGGTTTITFRNVADSLNRITATVDENGNRTAITLNAT